MNTNIKKPPKPTKTTTKTKFLRARLREKTLNSIGFSGFSAFDRLAIQQDKRRRFMCEAQKKGLTLGEELSCFDHGDD